MINTSSNLVMNHSTFLTLEKKESCVFLLCGRKPSKEKNEKKGLETKHGQKQKIYYL